MKWVDYLICLNHLRDFKDNREFVVELIIVHSREGGGMGWTGSLGLVDTN